MEAIFFLGGLTLENLPSVHGMLSRFWERYSHVEDVVEVAHPSTTIPWFLHGDEGRGLGKRPLLVISYQCCIGYTGEENINSKKNFGCYKYFCFPLLPNAIDLFDSQSQPQLVSKIAPSLGTHTRLAFSSRPSLPRTMPQKVPLNIVSFRI